MSKSEILEQLPKLQPRERDEIFDRLCELQEVERSSVHQKWIEEALESGPAAAASEMEWERYLQRGLSRGREL